MGGRAAIYARFSSHNQRGESIEIQVEKSRAYCAENDLRVVATYCDFAQTGTNTDRAEFQRMMADAKRGLFDFVVIYKVTRIMRNRDEMAMARIMLRRCRVEILYAGEDISDGSAGVLQLGMLEVLAEYESALDGERIRDGIQKNAERCMANGCVRYGWDIVDGRYVVNEEEAAAIRLGVRMVLSGKSVADVVRAWEPYRTKRGGKWRIDALTQRQALLKDELRTAEAIEAARLDYDRALFWLEGMAAAEVDDAQLLRTFVARVVLGGPDDDDGLRVAFTFDDSAGLGDNPSLPGAIGPGGEVFDRMNASSTISNRQVDIYIYLPFYF